MSQEDKINKFLGLTKRGEETHVFRDSFLTKTWYLESVWEKIIFVLGFFSLVWTLIKILLLQSW
jgi:hypothetical protein